MGLRKLRRVSRGVPQAHFGGLSVRYRSQMGPQQSQTAVFDPSLHVFSGMVRIGTQASCSVMAGDHGGQSREGGAGVPESRRSTRAGPATAPMANPKGVHHGPASSARPAYGAEKRPGTSAQGKTQQKSLFFH